MYSNRTHCSCSQVKNLVRTGLCASNAWFSPDSNVPVKNQITSFCNRIWCWRLQQILASGQNFSSLILFSSGSCGFHVNTSMSTPFETRLEESMFCLMHIHHILAAKKNSSVVSLHFTTITSARPSCKLLNRTKQHRHAERKPWLVPSLLRLDLACLLCYSPSFRKQCW